MTIVDIVFIVGLSLTGVIIGLVRLALARPRVRIEVEYEIVYVPPKAGRERLN